MTTPIRFLFFDAAQTLLDKPLLFVRISEVLIRHNVNIPIAHLRIIHKLLSELVSFPDKTSKTFYDSFNAELLLALGHVPDAKIKEDIFSACTYLPWEPFEDCGALSFINLPKGIVSNWDRSLRPTIEKHFPGQFTTILGSEESGCRKPDVRLFNIAAEGLSCIPEEVLFIGDSIKLDMIPAKLAGFQTALVDRYDVYPFYTGLKIKSFQDLKTILR